MALFEKLKLEEMTQDQVRELQNLLLRAGYNPGPVDGMMGPATKAAYSRFITAQGYDPSGMMTKELPRIVAQLSTNTQGAWESITLGSEPGSAPATATTPAQGVAPVSTAGTPSGTPAQAPTVAVPGMDDGTTEATVRQKYPHLSYLLDNPEVKDVLMRATQGGWDQATLQGELWKTTWWQTTSNATRLWDQKFAQDNATAMLEWDQRTVTISNLMSQLGFKLPENDVKWIAGRVLREGWSDDQLKRYLGQLARTGGVGPGQVTEQAAQLKALGKNYMRALSDGEANEYAIRIAEGSLTRDAVESMLRNEAKGRFTWLTEQIDSGLSPMDLFGSLRSAVAKELEVDPASIDFTDMKWSGLTNPVTGEDGKFRSMNFYEAQRWARSQAEWGYTDNANRQAAQLELDLLKAMGIRKG